MISEQPREAAAACARVEHTPPGPSHQELAEEQPLPERVPRADERGRGAPLVHRTVGRAARRQGDHDNRRPMRPTSGGRCAWRVRTRITMTLRRLGALGGASARSREVARAALLGLPEDAAIVPPGRPERREASFDADSEPARPPGSPGRMASTRARNRRAYARRVSPLLYLDPGSGSLLTPGARRRRRRRRRRGQALWGGRLRLLRVRRDEPDGSSS